MRTNFKSSRSGALRPDRSPGDRRRKSGYCERSEVHPLYSATLSLVTSFDGKSSTVEAGF
jgi:hypothetical protein